MATLGLLAAGGLVTSHGAGMAVPDWPNTYGYNMFFFPFSQWVGGIFYEHTHRLFASLVGLLTSVLALWLCGARARPWMRNLGLVLLAAALGALIAWPRRWSDALVLGLAGARCSARASPGLDASPAPDGCGGWGWRPFWPWFFKGCLADCELCSSRTRSASSMRRWRNCFSPWFARWPCSPAVGGKTRQAPPADFDARRLPSLVLATTLLILVQLILGAWMRHQHAGLAIPDFPLAYGKLWPPMDAASVALYNQQRLEIVSVNPITSFQIGLQMAHRIMAALILAAVAACAGWTLRRLGPKTALGKLALLWLGLVLAQALLGATTIWSNKAADIAMAHVLGGALCLALGTVQYTEMRMVPDLDAPMRCGGCGAKVSAHVLTAALAALPP